MKYYIIFTFIIISSFIYYKFSHKKSRFWINQPVFSNKEGQITLDPLQYDPNLLELINDETFKTVNKDTWLDFYDLLNNHYFDHLKYTSDYLKKQLDHSTAWILYKNIAPIGTITSHPVTIQIHNRSHKFNYVDHLLVKKGERGRSTATILISKIIESGTLAGIPRFIFKIEDNELPIPHFCKLTNYYGIKPKNIVGEKYEIKNLVSKQLYNFYNKYNSKYLIYLKFDNYSEFENYITKYKVKYILQGNSLKGMILYVESMYKGEKVAEIVTIFGDLIDMLIGDIDESIKWITMNDMASNMRWIRKFNLKEANITYLYFYNYFLNKFYAEEISIGIS